MKLALKVAEELELERDFLMENQIKIKICGDYNLIP